MSLSQAVYSVNGTPSTVVAPTHDHVQYVVKNLQPETVMEYARDGYIYLVNSQFSITSGSSVSFSIVTGATGTQFDFYSIVSNDSAVYAELIEGATITVTGSPITAYNLNRNASDSHKAVLKAASSLTGGTTISAEYIPASNQSSAQMSSVKIHTLKPNTQYGMKFSNLGNRTTPVHFQLGFSEHYNGYNTIWLDTLNNSYALRAGEELLMPLTPGATINAVTSGLTNKLSVMRQR